MSVSNYFAVTNYDQQQHYKDRGPTWIKLYNRLLDDYGFAQLPDAGKWHLIGIFLLASRHHNRIPADVSWLARQIGASDPVDLDGMERGGFISKVEHSATPFECFEKPASPEKSREEKNREETLLSAEADLFDSDSTTNKKKKYPAAFDEFWRDYPTDPLMSKIKAYAQWRRLTPADRAAALAALPSFRDFCKKQINYRVVHAQRYLSERRFDGFEAQAPRDEAAIAAAKDRADRLLKRGKYAERME